MNSWRLGFRFLLRDWRAGELKLLAAALVVAVAAVSSVAWLADRVGGASVGRAAELLAADQVLTSRDPIPDEWRAELERRRLTAAETLEFPSVVLVGERSSLVSVKAVEPGYPLRGALEVRSGPNAPTRSVQAVPEPGSAWIEPRLALQLELELGGKLNLGRAEFTVTRLLTLEPDRGGFFSSLAPRVMINFADVAATQLVQPASRVRYRLLLAGDRSALADFEQWAEARSEQPLDWQRPGEDQPGVENVLRNGQRFLGLGALLTVVIAGVAILLTVRRYAEQQMDRVAVMRCLGARQQQISAIFTWKLVWLGLVGGAAGTAIGYVLHEVMLALVADLLPPTTPSAGLAPALSGLVTALAALLGFALPTILRLRQVPPLRVLRRELGGEVLEGAGLYLVGPAIIFLLMWWQAGDARLAAVVFGAVLATLGALAGAALALVAAVRLWRRRGGGGLLWLSGISRRPVAAVVQVVGVGLGLMALFLLALVRNDLLDTWQGRIADDAPNYFLINVQPHEVNELRAYLAANGGIQPSLYPMVRGRLVAINDREVRPDDYVEPRTQRLVAREFNLSWADELYPDNRILSGRWWPEQGAEPDQLSVEKGIADRLGVGLGDRLTFSIGGREVTAEVTSLREVQWDSFNVNFFVSAPPGLLNDFPATFITSFHLPEQRQDVLPELVRRFPSVTVIDVSMLLGTARNIMDQGSRVVELMAALTLGAGLLVLLAALQITGEERKFETAVLRALGARRRRIRMLARAEFWLLGLTSGVLAGAIAVIAAHVAARELFQLHYPFNTWLVLTGGLIGLLVVWFAGALGTRTAYRSSPMRLLQETHEG